MITSTKPSFLKRHAMLGGIALAALLALPMGCLDQGDPQDDEAETAQELSSSFLLSCDSGAFSTALDTSTMRLFINHATASGCKRRNGSKVNPVPWNGRCFNDLSNRDGVLTCAAG